MAKFQLCQPCPKYRHNWFEIRPIVIDFNFNVFFSILAIWSKWKRTVSISITSRVLAKIEHYLKMSPIKAISKKQVLVTSIYKCLLKTSTPDNNYHYQSIVLIIFFFFKSHPLTYIVIHHRPSSISKARPRYFCKDIVYNEIKRSNRIAKLAICFRWLWKWRVLILNSV